MILIKTTFTRAHLPSLQHNREKDPFSSLVFRFVLFANLCSQINMRIITLEATRNIMKFVYIDETGNDGKSDTFVMCGLMIDAYKLKKQTRYFDNILNEIYALNPRVKFDLKTSKFINGKDDWSKIAPETRKHLLKKICLSAVDNGGSIFAISLSMKELTIEKCNSFSFPYKSNYWLASAFFIASIIQKKMQTYSKNKGLSVLIFDDNKQEIAKLTDELHTGHEWFDPLYQIQKKARGKLIWKNRTKTDRFDQIVNTAFFIKSNHSSLIQVSDAIAYVYRRYFELLEQEQAWEGERSYIVDLFEILERSRERLGRCPKSACFDFYKAVKHPRWEL